MNREVTAGRLAVRGYKLLYLFRPPEGWHHTAETYYGREPWACQWTRQDGNGTIEWIDAQLTPEGAKAAKYIHTLWTKYLGSTNLAMPQLFLSSPLSRAAETLSLAFNFNPKTTLPTSPIFVEYLRETFGVDTHNSRRSYTYLKKKYPLFEFEDEFSEDDPLWTSNRDEHDESVTHRAKIFLENLFLRREETYVAVGTHEGVIKAILQATGHRPFTVPVGHMIPIILKASWVKNYGPRTEVEKYKTYYKKDRNCTERDPVTDPDAEPDEDFEEYDL
ncbi:hypothetical protein ABW19_dt0204242 [Dactylella cylindrospora]|nr:hypothetical protein ABW19_dt0204242 [Dactylella cylindrospora]